jgi:hypothetical protein
VTKGEQDKGEVAEQCRKELQFQMSFGKMGGHMLLLEGVKLSDTKEGRLRENRVTAR